MNTGFSAFDHDHPLGETAIHAQADRPSGIHAQADRPSGIHAQADRPSGIHAQADRPSGTHPLAFMPFRVRRLARLPLSPQGGGRIRKAAKAATTPLSPQGGGRMHIPVNSATRSNSNPPLIPIKIRHMKQPLHLAVECLMAAKELPVELADLDGSRSAKGDDGLLIDRVRCTRKTGRWLPLAAERPLFSVRTAEHDPKGSVNHV
jgi:hypothetical protein